MNAPAALVCSPLSLLYLLSSAPQPSAHGTALPAQPHLRPVGRCPSAVPSRSLSALPTDVRMPRPRPAHPASQSPASALSAEALSEAASLAMEDLPFSDWQILPTGTRAQGSFYEGQVPVFRRQVPAGNGRAAFQQLTAFIKRWAKHAPQSCGSSVWQLVSRVCQPQAHPYPPHPYHMSMHPPIVPPPFHH